MVGACNAPMYALCMSIYEQEAEIGRNAEGTDRVVFMAASVLTMTIGFVLCAAFVTVALQGQVVGWLYILFSILKAVLLVTVMVLTGSIIAYVFDSMVMRWLNSFFVGVIFAFAFIFL